MVFTGCNGVPKYDERLVAADSLLQRSKYEIPRDSALKVLSSIPVEELTKESDQAYYSLLLTQAQYQNYIYFTNDSAINTAIKYYERHKKEREKLTRSYIYKGAVSQDLEDPDSAMFYYEMAELYADEKDDFNRGYAQLRMGSLYREYNAYDGRDIEKYRDASESFKKSNHPQSTEYQIVTLRDLGALYRFRNVENAEKTLNEAIALTKKEKDTTNYVLCVNYLAYRSFMQGDNEMAYKLLQPIKDLNFYNIGDNGNTSATFACVYANNGKVDSALHFVELAKLYNPDTAFYHSYNYLVPMAQIAKAQGNMLKYYRYSHIVDSLDHLKVREQDIEKIMYSEINCELKHNEEQDHQRRIRYYIMAGTMLLLALLALLFYRRAHRYDKLVLELKDQSKSQMQDLKGLQSGFNELKISDERLKSFISSHMGMMREMIDACYHEPNNRIAENMKRIVKFQDSNRENWVKLYDYIDLEHNNIMSRTRENYPELNEKDLLLLALTCMGYSYIQTAIVMGYSNATSVSVLKQRLAKKMGLDCSLNEYIDQYSKQEKQ